MVGLYFFLVGKRRSMVCIDRMVPGVWDAIYISLILQISVSNYRNIYYIFLFRLYTSLVSSRTIRSIGLSLLP